MNIRKARIDDVKEIHRLINCYAEKGEMLPRAFHELYEFLRDFYVMVRREKVVGCCALHISWQEMGEIRSLAVAPEYLNKGIGQSLLEKCLREARDLGLPQVFALTYKPDFFKKRGFMEIEKEKLPHKVWSDCIRCPKFPDCDEVALVMQLK